MNIIFKYILIIFSLVTINTNVSHRDARNGSGIPASRIKHQENVLERSIPENWTKFAFPYKATYIYRMWIDGSEYWAETQNAGFAACSEESELLFYGKITGDAIGFNFTELGERNITNFKLAAKNMTDLIPITYSSDFLKEWQFYESNSYQGTCLLPNGQQGTWLLEIQPHHEFDPLPSLQMLLIISFKRDPSQIYNEAAPFLLN